MFPDVGLRSDPANSRRACFTFDDNHKGIYGRRERPYVPRRPAPLAARLTGSAIRRPFASNQKLLVFI
jgi:hypothetical protein